MSQGQCDDQDDCEPSLPTGDPRLPGQLVNEKCMWHLFADWEGTGPHWDYSCVEDDVAVSHHAVLNNQESSKAEEKCFTM